MEENIYMRVYMQIFPYVRIHSLLLSNWLNKQCIYLHAAIQ